MEDNLVEFKGHQQVMSQLHTLIVEKWHSQTVPENYAELISMLEALRITPVPYYCETCGQLAFCQTSDFVSKCVLILKNACAIYKSSQKSTNQSFELLLSVQDRKQFDYFLFFIVKIGISRHMFFHITTLSLNFDELPEPTPCACTALLKTIRDLLESCDHAYVQTTLCNKYLLDILAGALQLAYSPPCRQLLSSAQRKSSLSLLTYVVTKWAKLVEVVKCLLALQGSSSSTSPPWLKQACGMLLSKVLLLPNGVFAMISGVTASLDDTTSDSKKAEIVSRILCTPPKAGPSTEEYIKIICSQIFQHFEAWKAERKDLQLIHQVMLESLFALYEKYAGYVKQNYFSKLFGTLYALTAEDVEVAEECMVEDVSRCLEHIHVVFTYLRVGNRDDAVIKELVPLMEIFFCIFKWSRSTVCSLQNILREIIGAVLNTCRVEDAVGILLALCNISVPMNQGLNILEMRNEVSFSLNEDGNLTICDQENDQSPENIVMEQDKLVQSIIDMVQSSKNDEIASRFFITMLEQLSDLQSMDVDDPARASLLQTPEDRAIQHLIAGESQLIIYALIMAFLENCDPALLLSDVPQISEFVKVMLGRIMEAEDIDTSLENLKLTFAILGLCLMCGADPRKQQELQEIVPLLQNLCQLSWLDQTDKDTATDIAIAIATQGKGRELDISMFSNSLQAGVANLTEALGKGDSTRNMDVETSSTEPPGAHNINNVTTPKLGSNNFATHLKSTSAKSNELNGGEIPSNIESAFEAMQLKSVEEAIDAVFDPSPPERGAAVRFLTNLIKKGDKAILKQQHRLYQLFVEQLKKENDSFVYLSLLQGIVEGVNKGIFNNKNENFLVEKLFVDYQLCLSSENNSDEVNLIKIGEVLVRFINQLGDMAPYYGQRLIPLLFVGCRNPSNLIRSSSLSNMAELCPLLRHNMSAFEQELTLCLTSIAKTDEAEPRRAAVYVIRRMIEILGGEILQVFPDSMKAFYLLLKHVYSSDEDGAARLQAQLALEHLDTVMKGEVFVNPAGKAGKTNSKKIVVVAP